MKRFLWVLLSLMVLSGCAAEEAPRVELQVVVDGSRVVPTKTDLGYTVALSEARMVLGDVLFTVRGEAHASHKKSVGDWLIAPAYAHPGHYQGGEVSGEMPGRFVVDFLEGDGAVMGTATLLTGNYESANFTFGHGDGDDFLLGITAVLAGVATRDSDGKTFQFVAQIESPKGRELVGAPFELKVTEQTSNKVGFRLTPTDLYGKKSLFDGINFAELADGEELITFSASNENEAIRENYFRIRRTFQTHDHFEFVSLN